MACSNTSILTGFIEDDMPPGNEAACDAQCAVDLAAYILTEFNAEVALDCSGPVLLSPNVLKRLSREEYALTLKELFRLAQSPDVSAVPGDPSIDSFRTLAEVQRVQTGHLNGYLSVANRLTSDLMNDTTRRDQVIGCDLNNNNCLAEFVGRFGQLAFRRPLEGQEVNRLVDYATINGTSQEDRYTLAIITLLGSPYFIYRVEVGDAQEGLSRLDSYELASRLAFALWGQGPDTWLMGLAAQGELDNPSGLKNTAEIMLGDTRAQTNASQFFRQWLAVDALNDYIPSSPPPGWYEGIVDDFWGETDRVIRDFAWQNTRFLDVFTAPQTYLTPKLAAFYGTDTSNAIESLDENNFAAAGFIYADSAATTGGVFNADYPVSNLLNNNFSSAQDVIDTTVDYIAAGQNYASLRNVTAGFNILFEFDKPTLLQGMYVWNYVFRNGTVGFTAPPSGVKDYTLTFYDGPQGTGQVIGSIYTGVLQDAPFNTRHPAETVDFGARYPNVRSVVMRVLSNHGSTIFTGMNELAFLGTAERFSRINLAGNDPRSGSGILGHASNMARRSDGDLVAQRGNWLRSTFLCETLDVPASVATQIEDGQFAGLSPSEILSARNTDPSCKICHAFIDPIGIALTVFDEFGRYDPNFDPEPMSILAPGFPDAAIPDATNANPQSVVEIAGALGELPDVGSCMADRMFLYLRNRLPEEQDKCFLESATQKFRDANYDFVALLLAFIEDPSFQLRVAPSIDSSSEQLP
jgi:hypothetical protein